MGSRWSQSELEKFYELYHTYGKDFGEYLDELPGRTEEHVQAMFEKNRLVLNSLKTFLDRMEEFYGSDESSSEDEDESSEADGDDTRPPIKDEEEDEDEEEEEAQDEKGHRQDPKFLYQPPAFEYTSRSYVSLPLGASTAKSDRMAPATSTSASSQHRASGLAPVVDSDRFLSSTDDSDIERRSPRKRRAGKDDIGQKHRKDSRGQKTPVRGSAGQKTPVRGSAGQKTPVKTPGKTAASKKTPTTVRGMDESMHLDDTEGSVQVDHSARRGSGRLSSKGSKQTPTRGRGRPPRTSAASSTPQAKESATEAARRVFVPLTEVWNEIKERYHKFATPDALEWMACEFLYSDMDREIFDMYEIEVSDAFAMAGAKPGMKLTLTQWNQVRRNMGKPRRFSPAFIETERARWYTDRDVVRRVQAMIHTFISDDDMEEILAGVNLPSWIPYPSLIGREVLVNLAGLKNETPNPIKAGRVLGMDMRKSTYRVAAYTYWNDADPDQDTPTPQRVSKRKPAKPRPVREDGPGDIMQYGPHSRGKGVHVNKDRQAKARAIVTVPDSAVMDRTYPRENRYLLRSVLPKLMSMIRSKEGHASIQDNKSKGSGFKMEAPKKIDLPSFKLKSLKALNPEQKSAFAERHAQCRTRIRVLLTELTNDAYNVQKLAHKKGVHFYHVEVNEARSRLILRLTQVAHLYRAVLQSVRVINDYAERVTALGRDEEIQNYRREYTWCMEVLTELNRAINHAMSVAHKYVSMHTGSAISVNEHDNPLMSQSATTGQYVVEKIMREQEILRKSTAGGDASGLAILTNLSVQLEQDQVSAQDSTEGVGGEDTADGGDVVHTQTLNSSSRHLVDLMVHMVQLLAYVGEAGPQRVGNRTVQDTMDFLVRSLQPAFVENREMYNTIHFNTQRLLNMLSDRGVWSRVRLGDNAGGSQHTSPDRPGAIANASRTSTTTPRSQYSALYRSSVPSSSSPIKGKSPQR
eukprot:Clim_evm9s157 gene=Clim_evmTU9s157